MSCGGCFPFGAMLRRRRKSAAGADANNQRQGLLKGGAGSTAEGDATPPPAVDLRRIFSRGDITGIPEHSEVNRGSDTNQTPPAAASKSAQHPPSPLPPGPPNTQLERLFSRGAGRNSPIALNRLFSRGALGRASSGLGTSWTAGGQQRPNRASTTDSHDDYGDAERIEAFGDSASQSSPLLRGAFRNVSNDFNGEEADADSESLSSTHQLSKRQESTSSTKSMSIRRNLPELAELIKKLQTVSEHLVPGSFKADTKDHEDHTFSGIYFNVEGRRQLPFQFIEIQSISIRGDLGLVSVYVAERGYDGKIADPSQWTRCFGPMEIAPSPRELVDLVLSMPIRLSPGMVKGIYIHSELPGDMAIVYDDLRSANYTYEDSVLRIHSGVAHISNVPFSQQAAWGGSAFRRGREFVGSMRYGVKLVLWTPEVHHFFPMSYRRSVFALLCAHYHGGHMKAQPSLSSLPLDVLFHIINMVPSDWFRGDDSDALEDEESEGENSQTSPQFKYGGHVGRIAELRHMFDTARIVNNAVQNGVLDEDEDQLEDQDERDTGEAGSDIFNGNAE